MLKKILCLCIMVTVLFFVYCTSGKVQQKYNNKILGNWERVGDESAGLVVKVEQLSNQDSYIGKIVYLPPKYKKIAQENDILWQNIRGVTSTQWEGTVLSKNPLFFGGARSSNYEAKYLLVTDTLLEIYTNNKTQKWIRKK